MQITLLFFYLFQISDDFAILIILYIFILFFLLKMESFEIEENEETADHDSNQYQEKLIHIKNDLKEHWRTFLLILAPIIYLPILSLSTVNPDLDKVS